MSMNISVKIKLYGFFKVYNMEYMFLLIPYNCLIKELREILLKEFIIINKFISVEKILNCSIFASNNNILDDNYVIIDKDILSLFPPVNGG